MKKYIFTLNDLSDCLNENNRIVIYGAGVWGQLLVDYIISVDKRDVIKGIAVTDKAGNSSEYRGIKVYETSELFRQENYFILIAVSNRYLEDVKEMVERHHGVSQYSCITGDLIISMQDRRKRAEWNGKIDFLMPGFGKCGTTSLHNVLRRFDDIYLSSNKESNYFKWCNTVEDPFKVLGDIYFNDIREGQLVGMIETNFVENPRQVYNTFGKDIKLIFLLRNPVKASFSEFLMWCRGAADLEMENAYQKYGGRFSVKMFDEYFKVLDHNNLLDCAHLISEFMKYYPREQIKVVFLEELSRNAREGMNDILKFIGSEGKYDADELPHDNKGSYVLADIESYRSLCQKYTLFLELRRMKTNDRQFDATYEAYKQICMKEKNARKLYNIKILPEQKKKAEDYYYNSVRDLEKLLDKDLSKLWF